MLVEQAVGRRERGAPLIDVNPYDDVSFPLGVARRQRSREGLRHHHRGLQRVLRVLRRARTRAATSACGPKRDILAEVRQAAAGRAREVQLLGQIVNHYQAPDDPACDFAALLEAVHEVPGVERIRFASPHPRHVPPRLIEAMRDLPKVCKHLHLPVQSGSTRVLEAMRRRYTRESYLELVDALREAVPGIALSTDMIVGFPGETEADFDDTLSLTRARPLPQHVLVQVLAAAEHAGREAAAGRCAARRRRRGGSSRCRRCSGRSRLELNAGRGRRRRRGARRRGEPAAREGALGAHVAEHGRELAGAARVDGPHRARCASSGPARTASGGGAHCSLTRSRYRSLALDRRPRCRSR